MACGVGSPRCAQIGGGCAVCSCDERPLTEHEIHPGEHFAAGAARPILFNLLHPRNFRCAARVRLFVRLGRTRFITAIGRQPISVDWVILASLSTIKLQFELSVSPSLNYYWGCRWLRARPGCFM